MVKSVEDDKVAYGEHLLEKMRGWVEFQDVVGEVPYMGNAKRTAVEAY